MDAATTPIPGNSAITSIRSLVPLAAPGSIYLFQGETTVLAAAMQELMDRFALQEPVQVVVGGNRISFDHLFMLIGEQAGDAYAIMDRISVSRAETCYQMLDVLEKMESSSSPLVITDTLDSFFEDDLTDNEVTLLLKKCLKHMQRLCQTAPLLIGATGDDSRSELLQMLECNSDMRFYFEPAVDAATAQMKMPGMQ